MSHLRDLVASARLTVEAFYGRRRSDMEDPAWRKRAMDRANAAHAAIKEWEKVRPSVKKEANHVVVLKLTPSFLSVKKKAGLA